MVVGGFWHCCESAGTTLGAVGEAAGMGCADRVAICSKSLVMVFVNWEICFCISRSLSFISLRPEILTVTDCFANWYVISARMKRQIGSSSHSVVSLVAVVWSSSEFYARKLASVSVSWSQSGA